MGPVDWLFAQAEMNRVRVASSMSVGRLMGRLRLVAIYSDLSCYFYHQVVSPKL